MTRVPPGLVPPRSPIVIGHRGASGYRPEHTSDAYELAFALGADAVEPDLVVSRDGVLVIRHENEISGTTDVAEHPEFAGRQTTKTIDGVTATGWYTEDFDWAELQTLRARERRPDVRPDNAVYHDLRLLCLADLIALIERESERLGRALGLVAEIKHATYFDSTGLPIGDLYRNALEGAGWSRSALLVTESFEQTVLDRLRERGVGGSLVYLIEPSGVPADRVARQNVEARGYADDLTEAGLDRLAGRVDGISVAKSVILEAAGGQPPRAGIGNSVVDAAHSRGLAVFCWTLRPENRYLFPRFRLDAADSAFGDWRSEFAAVLASGVDGVFADHPDLAVAARAEFDRGTA